MSDFESAMLVLFPEEGGFKDDPAHDENDPTNWGLSMGWFKSRPDLVQRYFGHPAPVTYADIKGMTQDTAKAIYRNEWWGPSGCGAIDDQTLGTKAFSEFVNMGREGLGLLQQAANRCGCALIVDCFVGPITAGAVNALDQNRILRAYCQILWEHYLDIIEDNPLKAKNRNGWMARAAWPYKPGDLGFS